MEDAIDDSYPNSGYDDRQPPNNVGRELLRGVRLDLKAHSSDIGMMFEVGDLEL